MIKKITWFVSFIITGIFVFLIGLDMYEINHIRSLDLGKVTNSKEFSDYLTQYYKQFPEKKVKTVYYVPTGIFIESFKFISSNTVNASGYIWQKYTGSLLKQIIPGIVFPEATEVKLYEAYKSKKNDVTTIGWYFEGNFTKNFNYKKFPLDHKIIWLRIWPIDFNKNIILIPDFSSYISTAAKSKFGIDPDIVLQGYSLIETFFSYKMASYDTNLGISHLDVNKEHYLEYYFNIAVQRNVLNTLVSYLLPLFVMIIFVFILLVNISIKIEQGILACCATFLFVILLSHLKLRESLTEGSIVYMEYIYFILYFALIYIVIVSFLAMKTNIKHSKRLKLMTNHNYLLLKAIFLPLLFGSILFITKLIL